MHLCFSFAFPSGLLIPEQRTPPTLSGGFVSGDHSVLPQDHTAEHTALPTPASTEPQPEQERSPPGEPRTYLCQRSLCSSARSQTLCAPQEPFYGLRTTPGVLPRCLELLHCSKLTLSVLLWGTCPLTALLLRASLTSQRAALPLLSLLPWLEKPSTAGTDGVSSWGGKKWHFLPNSWAGVWCQSYL